MDVLGLLPLKYLCGVSFFAFSASTSFFSISLKTLSFDFPKANASDCARKLDISFS